MKYKITFLYLIYLVSIGIILLKVVPKIENQGLYDEKSGIILLDKNNIHGHLNYSVVPWIVVFYAHWCGHCVQFVDTYTGFRKEITNWNIYVGAIDCASGDNEVVCADDFGVDYFPKILLFPCNEALSSKSSVHFKDIFGKRNIHTLRQASANFIINQTKCSPSFNRYPSFNLSFWNAFKTKQTVYQVMIIMFGSEEDIGVFNSIVLDLSGCNRFIVSMINLKNLNYTSLFGSYTEATIIAVSTDMKIELLSRTIDNYAEFRNQLYTKYSYLCPSLAALKPYIYTGSLPDTDDQGISENKLNTSVNDDIHITDIISGIGMSLRDEIPRADLSIEYIGYVKNWVETLYDCVPWPSVQKDFLHNLIEWMASQGNNLNSSEWRSFFKSSPAMTAFPNERTWITCKGKTPMYRGYPCSLWLTFHVMSIKCELPSKTFGKTSLDVLVAAKGFIVNFFGCGACREHFKEISKNVLKEAKNSREAQIWLWSRHNMVNARIRYDDSADPTAPKVQYPTPEKCPECHKIDSLKESEIYVTNPGYDIPKMRWNINRILAFLKNHYGAGNIRILPIKFEANNTDLYDPAVVSYRYKLCIIYASISISALIIFFLLYLKPERFFRKLSHEYKLLRNVN